MRLTVLAAIVLLLGCDAQPPRMPTVEPAVSSSPLPSGYPPADARLAAHHPERVPGAFQSLWQDAVKRSPTASDAQFFYHVAAAGDRAVAMLVPRVSMLPGSPVVMTHRTLAVEQAFTTDLSRAAVLSERQTNTEFGQALAFEAFAWTYNVVKVRTQREPPGNEREAVTLLIWRRPVTP